MHSNVRNIVQLVNFYGTRSFTTKFTRHLPLDPILSQSNLVHSLMPFSHKIHGNIFPCLPANGYSAIRNWSMLVVIMGQVSHRPCLVNSSNWVPIQSLPFSRNFLLWITKAHHLITSRVQILLIYGLSSDQFFLGNHEDKEPFGICRHRWDNIVTC